MKVTSTQFSLLLAIILVLSVAAPLTYGASFACEKATTKVERLICADPQLSDMDSELDRSYRKARESEKLVNNKDKLREQQIIWLHDIRDRCLDPKCVRAVYEQRISQLNVPQTPDNCVVADQGVIAAVATCSGRELQIEEQYLANLIKVVTLTKPLTDTQALSLKKIQADWEKNRECHCWSKADGYSSGTRAAILIGCQLKETKSRIAEMKKMLQGESMDFGGNSLRDGACN